MLIGEYAYRKDNIFHMYRNKLEEIMKEKGYTKKRWSEESGVSIDTIDRIIHPENPTKDSPKVNTLEEVCKPFRVELWEIFFTGDKNLVSMKAKLSALETERENLIAENAELRAKVATLTEKVDSLKDEIIETHRHYIKLKTNN